MPAMTYALEVELEDGSTWEVVADQRDVAQWELQPFGCSFATFISKVTTFFRFIGWNASKRQGKTQLSWDDFDAQCVFVGDQNSADDDAENPGKPVAPDSD